MTVIQLDFSKLPLVRRCVLAWRMLRGQPTRVSERVPWWSPPLEGYVRDEQRLQQAADLLQGRFSNGQKVK